jgi:hypothetical protein
MASTYTFTIAPNFYTFTIKGPDAGAGGGCGPYGFECFDVYGPAMANIFIVPGVIFSRGTPWATIDGSDLSMMSNDGVPTIMSVELPISQVFTFETTFYPNRLPTNLNDLSKQRFFLAAYDKQDNAGGVLISQQGLAIVSSFGNQVMAIAGSQDIFEEGDEAYTLRMVVDGANNVMDLYITRYEELIVGGHQLRYTSAAPITPAGTADHIRVEIIGQPSNPVHATFASFRVNCDRLCIPNHRPVADTGPDQTAVVGSTVLMDGTDSFDPEGAELSYLWSLVGAPNGSSFKSEGDDGFTVDDGDADGFTTWLEATGDAFSVENMPSLQPGDILVVDDLQYVVAVTDWDLTTTGEYERNIAWDDNKLRIVLDKLPDNLVDESWTIYHQSTFWGDRTEPQPTNIPDVPGLYTLQLVVNDGELDSFPAAGLVNIHDSNTPFGCIPDVNFIWDYLSDAWDLYDDKGPVTTAWSGFAQVATNILMTAWQYDYGKSLVDIQRQFQRRWLNYSTLVTESVADRFQQEIRYIRGRIVSVDLTGGVVFAAPSTLIISKDGGDPVTVNLSGTMTAQEISDAVTAALGERASKVKTATVISVGGEFLALVHGGLLVIHEESTAIPYLFSGWTGDIQNSLSGLLSTTFGNAFTAVDVLADLSAASKDDVLVRGGIGYKIQKKAVPTQLTTYANITATTDQSWEVSSNVKVASNDFTAELVRAGDIARFEVRETGASSAQEILCRVTGARGDRLGFDPRPIYEVVGGNLTAYEVVLLDVRRVSSIALDDLVVRIPRLQEIIVDPPRVWSLNKEYTISTNSDGVRALDFEEGTFSFDNPPPDNLWAEITYLDNRQMIEDNFGLAVDFKVENLETQSEDLDYLSAVRGLWYAFFNGPSLWNVRIGTQILLGLPFAEVEGTIEDINLTYNATTIRMLIRDRVDSTVVRSYFIPRNRVWEGDGESMVAINPETGVEYVAGDDVEQFYPLSKGVEILDWIKDPEWWSGFYGQGLLLELDKYFRFMVRADIDVFSIANLVFAIDFVKKIKPHYTYPAFVILKRLPPDQIDVTDSMTFHGTLWLVDDPAAAQCIIDQGTGGSYRFDDTNESGVYNWAFDGVPNVPTAPSAKPEFLYDKRRLCPREYVLGIMVAEHLGGYFPFDWIWAFDDGPGTDAPPLSGPLGAPPPSGGPYGPLVGTIQFDTTYPAGWYTRGKLLSKPLP